MNKLALIALLLVPACAGAWESKVRPQLGWPVNDDVSVAVPLDGRTRSFRSWDNGQLRWGWVEGEASGDYRAWDNERGYQWGRIEVDE